MAFGLPAAMGAVGGLMSGFGAQGQQEQQNRYNQQAASYFNPASLTNAWAAQNPFLAYAMYGQGGSPFATAYGGGGTKVMGQNPMGQSHYGGQAQRAFQGMANNPYAQGLAQLAQQPGYIDPELMNQTFHMSAMKGNQDLVAAQGRMGRSGLKGGMGDAYNLANRAAGSQRDVAAQQQYTLFREQQRRADLGQIANMYGQSMGNAMGAAGGAGQFIAGQQAPMNNMQLFGNAIQGATGAGLFNTGGGGGGGGGFGGFGGQFPTSNPGSPGWAGPMGMMGFQGR